MTVTDLDDFQRRGVELVRTETAKALREASRTVRVELDPDHLMFILDLLDDSTHEIAGMLRVQLSRDLMRYRR